MRVSLGKPALWGMLGLLLSCGGSDPSGPRFEVSFDDSLARGAANEAVRVELYLVEACSEVELGTRPVPALATATVLRDGPSSGFNVLPAPGDYGLYGVAQDADCAVMAAGCETVEVSDATEVLGITLRSLDRPGCPAALECSFASGECVDGSGGTGGDGGVSGSGGAGGNPIVRVDQGLIVLYDFDEGSGSTVADQAGVSPALDLTIQTPSNVTWGDDHLTIDSNTTLQTSGAATRIYTALTASQELTLEAWVKPGTLEAPEIPPDRIVSMSSGTSARNFLLGQDTTSYSVRYRTEGESNGNPTVPSSPGTAGLVLAHIVYTHDTNGDEVIYIDGVVDTTNTRVGDTSTWDPDFPLVVANETTGNREWLGELHLIAIYERALSAAEVEQNFDAGP